MVSSVGVQGFETPNVVTLSLSLFLLNMTRVKQALEKKST
jgi:hypothetical protein